jgi:hypothetical protein
VLHWAHLLLNPFANLRVSSHEERLAAILGRAGPFIAIGDPRDRQPPLGAARLYLDPAADWRTEVADLASRSALVVLRPGWSEGVRLETELSFDAIPPERLVLFVPSDGGRRLLRRAEMELLFRTIRGPRAESLRDRAFARAFVYFDADGTPKSTNRLGRILRERSLRLSRPTLRLDALDVIFLGGVALVALFSSIALASWLPGAMGAVFAAVRLLQAASLLPRGLVVPRHGYQRIPWMAGAIAMAYPLVLTSVASGFEEAARAALRGASPDLTITVPGSERPPFSQLEESLRRLDQRIVASAPLLTHTAFLPIGERVHAVQPRYVQLELLGVDWERDSRVRGRPLRILAAEDPQHPFRSSAASSLESPAIAVSRSFVRTHLGIDADHDALGRSVALLVPVREEEATSVSLVISAVYDADDEWNSGHRMFLSANDLKRVLVDAPEYTSVTIRVATNANLDDVKAIVASHLPAFRVETWEAGRAEFFSALRTEQRIVFALVVFGWAMVLLACMVYGGGPKIASYMVAASAALAMFVLQPGVLTWINDHFRIFPPDVYLFRAIPSRIGWKSWALALGVAWVLGSIAEVAASRVLGGQVRGQMMLANVRSEASSGA